MKPVIEQYRDAVCEEAKHLRERFGLDGTQHSILATRMMAAAESECCFLEFVTRRLEGLDACLMNNSPSGDNVEYAVQYAQVATMADTLRRALHDYRSEP